MIPAAERMIPSAYSKQEPQNPAYAQLVSVIDAMIAAVNLDIIDLKNIYDPLRCKAAELEAFGDMVAADLFTHNTEIQKRVKIATAIQRHKLRSTWEDDAKIIIDNIVGADSEIITNVGGDDWILCEGDVLTPAGHYWSTMGCDGVDDALGLALIGSGDEIEQAGNVYADVDSATLTAADISILRIELKDIVPAYLRIFLGYVTGTSFTVYANGIIE